MINFLARALAHLLAIVNAIVSIQLKIRQVGKASTELQVD